VGEGLRVGHVHLHVGDVEEGLRFYRDIVGFEVQTLFSGAAFVSACGYHHHLGLNTWRGENVGPGPPSGVVGLREWTIILDNETQVAEVSRRVPAAMLEEEAGPSGLFVRDPWDIAVRFTPATAA
jgi:catechol 2,3-dioxygenase